MKKLLVRKQLVTGLDQGNVDPALTTKLLRVENMWKTRGGVIVKRPGLCQNNDTRHPINAQRMAPYKGTVVNFGPSTWSLTKEEDSGDNYGTYEAEPDSDASANYTGAACCLAHTRAEPCVADEEEMSAFDTVDSEDGATYALSLWDKANSECTIQIRDRATHSVSNERVYTLMDGPFTFIVMTEGDSRTVFAVSSVAGSVAYAHVNVAHGGVLQNTAVLPGVGTVDPTAGYLMAAHRKSGLAHGVAVLFFTNTSGEQDVVTVTPSVSSLVLDNETVWAFAGRHIGIDWDETSAVPSSWVALSVLTATNSVVIRRMSTSAGTHSTVSTGVTGVATESVLNGTASVHNVGGTMYISVFVTRIDLSATARIVDGGSPYLRDCLSVHTATVYDRAMERGAEVQVWDCGISGSTITPTLREIIPQVQLCGRAFRPDNIAHYNHNDTMGTMDVIPVYFEGLGSPGLGVNGTGTSPTSWEAAMATAQRHLFFLTVPRTQEAALPSGKSLGFAAHFTGSHDQITGLSPFDRQAWLPMMRKMVSVEDYHGAFERVATPTQESDSRCGGTLVSYNNSSGSDVAGMHDSIGRLTCEWGKSTEETEEHFFAAASVPHMFDGRRFFEVGFLAYPELTCELVQTTSQWDVVALTFPLVVQYIAIYTEVDAKGHEHVSGYAAQVTTVDLSTSCVFVSVPWLPLTARLNQRISLYRSVDGGATFIQIFAEDGDALSAGLWPGTIANVAHHSCVCLDRGDLDTQLTGAETPLYTAGKVLQAVQPPPSTSVCEHQGRLFWVHGDRRSTTIEYSTVITAPAALRHSDFLTVQVPSDGGDITALASWQDYLIVFKRDAIYAVSGEGLTMTGLGSGYARARLVSSGIGCTCQRSLVQTPIGLIFLASRGFTVLGSGLSVAAIGVDVTRKSVGYDCVGAVYNSSRNVALFFVNQVGIMVLSIDEMAWSTWDDNDVYVNKFFRAACEGSVWLALFSTNYAYDKWETSWPTLDQRSRFVATRKRLAHDASEEVGDVIGGGINFIKPAYVSCGWESLGEEVYLRRILFHVYVSSWGPAAPSSGQLRCKLAYDYEPAWADDYQEIGRDENPNTYTWEDLIDMDQSVASPGAHLFEVAPHQEGIRCTAFRWELYDDDDGVVWSLVAVTYDLRRTGELKRLGERMTVDEGGRGGWGGGDPPEE